MPDTISGLVAILDDEENIIEYRDLGPAPVAFKAGYVLPVTDVKPALTPGQTYGEPTVQRTPTGIVRTYPAVDPPPPTLTKRQIGAALIASGVTLDPDAWVDGALAFVADPVQRALALNDWKTAPYYDRSHPMFNNAAVLSGTGLSEQQIDQLWALAATLPA